MSHGITNRRGRSGKSERRFPPIRTFQEGGHRVIRVWESFGVSPIFFASTLSTIFTIDQKCRTVVPAYSTARYIHLPVVKVPDGYHPQLNSQL
jgi:hypothetical protein